MSRLAALAVGLPAVLALAPTLVRSAPPSGTAAGAEPPIVMPGGPSGPAGPAAVRPGARSSPGAGCLPTGNGYLRARVRGALNLDIDWHNAQIECQGEPRSDGTGIRVSFAGPRADGRRLRMVFGVNAVHEGRSGRALPTNLTVIVEGGQRLYATRGEDRCTVDSLDQQRLSDSGAKSRSYRIVARGFCVAPASTLNDAEHILVSSFDFAGAVVFGTSFEEGPLQAPHAQISGRVNAGR